MQIDRNGDIVERSGSHWEILNDGKIVISNTPESWWANAVEYFRWSDEHPIINKKTVMTGKEAGKKVCEELIRPYSLRGLCIHCGISEEYIIDIKHNKEKDSLYYKVLQRIEYVIHTQNLEHAMVGVFNPILTSKILSLDISDDTEQTAITVNIVGDLPKLSESEDEIRKLDLKK